jgi:outer membrane protein OmpA-like peptidoglycan-associated protein
MSNRFKGSMLLALLALLACTGAHAASDCDLGQRYLQLAKDRMAAFAQDEALDFLRQSSTACPSYEAYQQFGELAAQSAEREQQTEAVNAFVQAHSLATTDENRARSLYQYARLLSLQNDPQNAYPLIKQAQQLKRGDGDIDALANRLDEQIRNPKAEQLVRGLRDSLYQPLKVAALSSGSGPGRTQQRSAAAVTSSKPSVNIQINFVEDSTEVDAQTRPNVAILARALADPSLAGGRFMFVGHADVRGTDEHNMELSRRRSQALSQAIVELEPGLAGRIDTTGRGEAEPLDPSATENAYRANRRLQVLLE